VLALASARPDAQSAGGPFRYERDVAVTGRGPQRLDLDATVLAGGQPFAVARRTTRAGDQVSLASGGLADLRFYDAAGRETPYLLVEPRLAEPVWMRGQVLPIAATRTTSGFEADFGRAALVDRLRVEGVAAPFVKSVRVEGSGDRARWTQLTADITLFDLPAERLQRLDVDVTPGEFRYVRFVFDDRSSARVASFAQVLARVVDAMPEPPAPAVALAFTRRPSEPGKSRYVVRLPGPRLPLVSLDLAIGGGNVLRDATVSEARLTGSQVASVRLGASTLRRAVRGELSASALAIPIEPPRESQIELTVEDGNNPPLDITGITGTLARLPWVFFDVPAMAPAGAAGAPILARFGNPKVGPPQYDLEAERGSLAGLHPAEATWGAVREAARPAATTPGSDVPETGSPVDVSAFTYHREIPAGRPGPASLLLDAAVLAHSPNLADLRIVAADGRQVPYLTERRDEPLEVTLPALEKDTTSVRARAAMAAGPGTVSLYVVRLPYANLPDARLSVTTSARVFRRDVRLERDPQGPSEERAGRPVVVASATWAHADPGTAAPPLVLDVAHLATDAVRLVVTEGDNAALPLGPPTLLLPGHRIHFWRRTTDPLRLVYGNPRLGQATYDLSLAAPTLLGASADEVAAGPEQATPPPAARTTIYFWAALILAIVVLLGLIARLLKRGRE
jgi:hypothetical protein